MKYWYAVMKDWDDNYWGTGSFDLEEAKSWVKAYYPTTGYIAVIVGGKCVDEIYL